jgi:hypothetical protein
VPFPRAPMFPIIPPELAHTEQTHGGHPHCTLTHPSPARSRAWKPSKNPRPRWTRSPAAALANGEALDSCTVPLHSVHRAPIRGYKSHPSPPHSLTPLPLHHTRPHHYPPMPLRHAGAPQRSPPTASRRRRKTRRGHREMPSRRSLPSMLSSLSLCSNPFACLCSS